MDKLLLEVLEARETRWNSRLRMAADYGQTLVTITLCLPHACRTHPDYTSIFPRLCGQVLRRLRWGGLSVGAPLFLEGADGPACLLPVSGEAAAAKRLCVAIERRLAGGRMLDVDVMDSQGAPIGRSQLELPPRSCFICQEPAAVCVSHAHHPAQEVLAKARQLRREYLDWEKK